MRSSIFCVKRLCSSLAGLKASLPGEISSPRSKSLLLEKGSWQEREFQVEDFKNITGDVDIEGEAWEDVAAVGLGLARLAAKNVIEKKIAEGILEKTVGNIEEILGEDDTGAVFKIILSAAALEDGEAAAAVLNSMENDENFEKMINNAETDTLAALITAMGQLRVRNDVVLKHTLSTLSSRRPNIELNYASVEHHNVAITPHHAADVIWGLASLYHGETDGLITAYLKAFSDVLCILRNEGDREGSYKLSKKPSGMSRYDAVVFRVPARPLLSHLPPEKITQTLWSLSVTNTHHEMLLKHATEQLITRFPILTPEGLVSTAYAISKGKLFSPEFMYLHAKFCNERISEFTPFQLKYLVNAYSAIQSKDGGEIFDPSPVFETVRGSVENLLPAKRGLNLLDGLLEVVDAGLVRKEFGSKSRTKKIMKIRKKIIEKALKIPQVDPENFLSKTTVAHKQLQLPFSQTETFEENSDGAGEFYEPQRRTGRKVFPSKLKSIEAIMPHGDPLNNFPRLKSSRAHLPAGGLKWGTVDI